MRMKNANAGCGTGVASRADDGRNAVVEVIVGGARLSAENIKRYVRDVEETQRMLEKLGLRIPLTEFGTVEEALVNGQKKKILIAGAKYDKLEDAVQEYDKVRGEMLADFERFSNLVGRAWCDRYFRGFGKEESRVTARIKNFSWTGNELLKQSLSREYKKQLAACGVTKILIKRFKYGQWLFAVIPQNGVVKAELPSALVGYLINRRQTLGIKRVEVVSSF